MLGIDSQNVEAKQGCVSRTAFRSLLSAASSAQLRESF
jgi:hypothetical protein